VTQYYHSLKGSICAVKDERETLYIVLKVLLPNIITSVVLLPALRHYCLLNNLNATDNTLNALNIQFPSYAHALYIYEESLNQ
jgi:hypothetical protein